jgi:hypothetical protein
MAARGFLEKTPGLSGNCGMRRRTRFMTCRDRILGAYNCRASYKVWSTERLYTTEIKWFNPDRHEPDAVS